MKNELSLSDIIQRQIVEQETNYHIALLNGKSMQELRAIQDKIKYLRSHLVRVQKDYKVSSQDDLSNWSCTYYCW
jgi:hypothetical protein